MGDKAGIWLRVSTTGQDEENQRPKITGWCTERGYEVVKPYVLHGYSASKGTQTAKLAEVLDDMRAGLISVLVCFSDSRIERRGIFQLIPWLGQVLELGCRVEFVTQPALNDLTTMGGRIGLVAASEVSREEGERRNIASQAGLDAARANGAATGSAPWAYHIEGEKRRKRFVFEAEHQPLIERIYKDVAGGMSAAQAAGVHSTPEKTWYSQTVTKLIRNPVYKGTSVDKSGVITHRCEAAVDAALWASANKALSDKARKMQGRGPRAMLSKIAVCGLCDAPMYRTPEKRGRWTRYYRCSASHGVAIPLPLAEAAVTGCLLDVLGSEQLTRREKIEGHDWAAEIEECKFELRHLDPDADDYDSQHLALRARLAELKNRPSVPGRWDVIPLGVTFGEAFTRLSGDMERGEFLRSAGVRAYFKPIDRDSCWISLDWGTLAPQMPLDVEAGERYWTRYRRGPAVM